MAVAVLAVGGLHAALPDDFRTIPSWVLQGFLVVFLAVLVLGDPGRIDRDKPWLHATTAAMIGLITAANALAVGHLVQGILNGAQFASAAQLLQIGVVVWLVNVIAFALWFWDLDGGGAAARASGRQRVTRAFVFPESNLPEHADDGWFPHFVDYLALSFNTATAFSPTDVSAVKPWSKLLVMAESMTSLAVALLVLARAINILPTGS